MLCAGDCDTLHSRTDVLLAGLVAWRIKNCASVVGNENVIASTGCGFSQRWNMIRVRPVVQRAKQRTPVRDCRRQRNGGAGAPART
jgi:hypothetical protein